MTEQEVRRHPEDHAEALGLARMLGRLVDQGRMARVDVNVVDGIVMMSPISLEHSETLLDLASQLRGEARKLGLRLATDVQFEHPLWGEPRCPDLAVWEPPAGPPEGVLDAEAILLAIEIVSVSSVENDYAIKDVEYRRAHIPAYLLVDPYTRTWRLRTGPNDDGWERTQEGKYGAQLVVELPGGQLLELDTITFMEAPRSKQRDHWPAKRLTLGED